MNLPVLKVMQEQKEKLDKAWMAYWNSTANYSAEITKFLKNDSNLVQLCEALIGATSGCLCPLFVKPQFKEELISSLRSLIQTHNTHIGNISKTRIEGSDDLEVMMSLVNKPVILIDPEAIGKKWLQQLWKARKLQGRCYIYGDPAIKEAIQIPNETPIIIEKVKSLIEQEFLGVPNLILITNLENPEFSLEIYERFQII